MPQWISDWMPIIAILLGLASSLVLNVILLSRGEQNKRLFEIWKDKKAYLDMVVDKTANFWVRYMRSDIEEINFDFYEEITELVILAPKIYYDEVHEALKNFVDVAGEVQEKLESSSRDTAVSDNDALGKAYWKVFHSCQKEKRLNPRKDTYQSHLRYEFLNKVVVTLFILEIIGLIILSFIYFPFLRNFFFS